MGNTLTLVKHAQGRYTGALSNHVDTLSTPMLTIAAEALVQ
jgi:hypothetical protein